MNLNSTVRFTSNGSVTNVDLTYNVQDTDVVQVFFEGEEQTSGWTLNRGSSPQRVTFDPSPPAGAEVLIRRYTDMREVPHEFYQHGDGRGGAEFNAKNLDENFDKIKRAAQDAMDSFELVGINVEAARDAEQYAAEAKGYRDTAQTYRNQSETYKNQAETASTDADTHKQQAANSALQASTSAGDSLNQANLAEGYAQSALTSKQSADIDAQAATGAAQSAEADRILAQTARQQAQGYATNASTKATEALQHAGDAQQSAANASSSEGAAFSSEQVAISKAGEASQSAEDAYKWANEDEDVPVESGEFSAKHWAIKAQDVVQGDFEVHVQDTDSVSWTGDGSVLNPLKATVGEVTWDNLQNKPSEFPPSSHTHDFTTLTNRPAYYPTNWASVSSKPSTFPADPHSHTWSSVTDKPDHFPAQWSGVSGKPSTFPPSNHNHAWGDITGKPSSFTPATHSHTWASITGKPSTFSPSPHGHSWSDITQKPNAFTPTSHTHSRTQITGLGTAAQYNVGWETNNVLRVGNTPNRTGYVLDMPTGSQGLWEVDENNSKILGFPALGGQPSTPRCWLVECFGTSNRRVLRATEIFGQSGHKRGTTYVRVLHDTTWHDWIRLNYTAV